MHDKGSAGSICLFNNSTDVSLSIPVIPAHPFKVLCTFKSWSPQTAVCILAPEEIPIELPMLLHNPKYGFGGRIGSVQHILKRNQTQWMCISLETPKRGFDTKGQLVTLKKLGK